MKNFIDDIGITGHLTIIKKYNDGEEEIVFDDHNIIVSGMGTGLSYMFNGSGSNTVLDYQIDRFQIGVSGPPAGGVVSSMYELSGALSSLPEYGTGSNLFIEIASQMKANLTRGDELNINEIGLLMKNPTGNAGTNRSLLTAYRTFSNIRKTNDFSLIFRWTLNF